MKSVRETLLALEADLLARIAELTEPLQRELRDLRVALAALDARPIAGGAGHSSGMPQVPLTADSWSMTIKDMVRQSLMIRFPSGATALQILESIHQDYGRTEIARSSLSPQLSRLKDEGVLAREGRLWRLKPDAGLAQRDGTESSEAVEAEEPPVPEEEHHSAEHREDDPARGGGI